MEMALFDREFIATPDDRKGQILYKHPDQNIRKYTKAIVNFDQQALFVNKGEVIATLGPGQHPIDADEIPGLGVLIDNVIAKNMYKAELYFVSTKEFVDEPFGGRIDDVFDPQTKQLVSLRVFGEYSLRAVDPTKIVTTLVGSVDCSDNEKITDWVDQMLLKTMKVDVTRNIVRNGWPIMGLSAYMPELETSVLASTNEVLASYGLALVRMGNFDINLSDEDLARLKKYANDVVYSQLAGSYTEASRAEMMRGAGEGMAQGGGAVSGAFLGAGIGVGGMTQQAAPAPAAAPPTAAFPAMSGGATANCASCNASNPAGTKFCGSCGTSLAPPTVACTSCSTANPAGTKFCGNCGSSLVPVASNCTGCGSELAPGIKFCGGCGKAKDA
jgi:membrane protease subunit (stomatin/prohibitin family)